MRQWHFGSFHLLTFRFLRAVGHGRLHWDDSELLRETLRKLEVFLVIHNGLGVCGAHILFRYSSKPKYLSGIIFFSLLHPLSSLQGFSICVHTVCMNLEAPFHADLSDICNLHPFSLNVNHHVIPAPFTLDLCFHVQ